MFIFFSVLIIIVSILLVLIVLVQNSKGGGLSAGFSSSNQYMGVRKTADFLEKATWTLAISLVVLCLLSTITINRNDTAPKSAIEDKINNVTDPNAVMNYPTQQAPAAGNQAPGKPADNKEAAKPAEKKTK